MAFRRRLDPDHPIPPQVEDTAARLLDAAFEVHKELGPGLYEEVYVAALALALSDKGISCRREVPIAASFRGRALGTGYRADLIVQDTILVEVKALSHLNEAHLAQVVTYLRFSGLALGFLINFNEQHLRAGIHRRVGPAAGTSAAGT